MSLDRVSSPFRRVLPEVYAAMGYEAERFFSSLPDTVRHRWLVRGQWMVLGGFVVSAAALCKLGSEVGGVAITPVLAFMLIGGLLIVLSRWMPQRTTVGAEEAERWLAFRRYLKNLKWYGDLAEAQRILDRHFAYAVALDVEEVVMAQAEEMGGRMPVWTRPVQVGGRNDAASTGGVRPLIVQHEPEPRPAQLSGGRMKRVEKDRPSVSLPTLDGVSREMAKTLDKASDGLTHLLDGAAGDGTDTPFSLVVRGTGKATEMTWHATTSTFDVLGDILEVLGSSGGGSGGYSGSSSRSSWSSSRSSSFSRSSSSRSSSSRSSGGGGRRGFG